MSLVGQTSLEASLASLGLLTASLAGSGLLDAEVIDLALVGAPAGFGSILIQDGVYDPSVLEQDGHGVYDPIVVEADAYDPTAAKSGVRRSSLTVSPGTYDPEVVA